MSKDTWRLCNPCEERKIREIEGWWISANPLPRSRRIDEAEKYVALEQLCLSPQCGFSSTIEGNKVTVEDEIKKLRLVVEVAREVWGEA